MYGIGTVAGALLTAWLGASPHKVRLIGLGYAVWAIALGSFAFSASLWPALGPLVVVGAAQNLISATTTKIMQERVTAQMRRHIMSLNTMVMIGVRPLGDYRLSAAISLFGVRSTTAATALVIGITSLLSLGPRSLLIE